MNQEEESLSGSHEVILDMNGNILLSGDEVLIISKYWVLPFYRTVYVKADNKLYINLPERTLDLVHPIPPQVRSVRDIIDNEEYIELLIPIERYEFILVDDISQIEVPENKEES